MTIGTVAAEPYDWPYDGALDPSTTALLCIDWQTDFCGPGGYVDAMGYDLNLTRAGLEPTSKVLAATGPGLLAAPRHICRLAAAQRRRQAPLDGRRFQRQQQCSAE